MNQWNPFPYQSDDYRYEGKQLKQHWDRLHAGDRIHFPSAQWVESLLRDVPDETLESCGDDAEALSAHLQSAWRAFHAGDFGTAVRCADEAGVLGADCACKSIGIYASYLESGESRKQALYREAISRGEQAIELLPALSGSHYFHAFNLGRLGQSISIGEALRKGMAGKIRKSLDTCLQMEPDHAEAHTAMGMYHAEIIAKVGKMVGGLTYGANTDEAISHFETAIGLVPFSPIAHIEYGNGLYLLYGDKRLDDVTDLYVKASELEAVDAMERLDAEAAAAELE